MSNVRNTTHAKGALVAAAVATLFATAAPMASAQATNGKVHCTGANSCKGQSACKSATNDCKGKNGCKGQGFIVTQTEKECRDKGGKPTPEPKK